MSLDPVNEQVVEGEAAQSIDSEQGPDLRAERRRTRINDLVAKLIAGLPPGQLWVTHPICLKDPKAGQVVLRCGSTLPREVVVDTMLRLELLLNLSSGTFMALVKGVESGAEFASDWHRISLGVYGLGEATKQQGVKRIGTITGALIEGMGSTLDWSRASLPRREQIPANRQRYDFVLRKGVEDIVRSAISLSNDGDRVHIRIVSPEAP